MKVLRIIFEVLIPTKRVGIFIISGLYASQKEYGIN